MKNGIYDNIGECHSCTRSDYISYEFLEVTEVHDGFYQFKVENGYHMQKGMKNLGRIDYSFNEKLDEGITIEKD